MSISVGETGPANWRSVVGGRLARGFLILLPVGVTFAIFQFAFDTLDGQLQPVIEGIFGQEVRGLGFLLILLIALMIGAFGPLAVIRYPGKLLERGIRSLPIAGDVYFASKQIAESMSATEGAPGLRTVVRIEYPRRGAWTVGFLTKTVTMHDDEVMAVVYMPSTPLPNTGWMVLIPIDDVEIMDMSTQEAMQFILTGGIVSPDRIACRPITEADLNPQSEV